MNIGIDFSLTATGVCSIIDAEAATSTVNSKPGPEWWSHPRRVREIAADIARVEGVALRVPDAWAIETPSFGSKGQLDRLYSGWWGVVDELMRAYGWPPPLRVTPSQVKKFATGKGNSNKDAVMLAVARRYPEVAVSNNNETDALVLAAIAAAVHGEPFAGTLTKPQQEVVDAVRAGAKEEP